MAKRIAGFKPDVAVKAGIRAMVVNAQLAKKMPGRIMRMGGLLLDVLEMNNRV